MERESIEQAEYDARADAENAYDHGDDPYDDDDRLQDALRMRHGVFVAPEEAPF